MAYGEAKATPRRSLNDDKDFRNVLRNEIDQAISYVDGELSIERTLATEYYRGDLFGDEVEGRSRVVMTVLRDVVTQIMPGLMRVFAGSDRAAEFAPTSEDKVALAEQATDYVNHVVMVDNPGFLTIHAAFKDALIRSLGVVKWWWDEREVRHEESYTGLSLETLDTALAAHPDAEVMHAEQDDEGLINLTLRRTTKQGRCRIEALPPEEFLINRSARSIDEARYVAHRRTDLTIADLVAMGYDEDEVMEHAGVDTDMEANTERVARHADVDKDADESVDPRMRPVLYIESYMEVPDEDGVPVLRKICTVGPEAYVLHEEAVPEKPFADFCPDPEPHTMNGSGYFQRTRDLQRIMSHLVRSVLDSLTQSIHPRTAFVEGAVNVEDLLNPEVGGYVRMTAPGMVQPMLTPFVGREALPVLELFNGIKEERTGVTKAASGLDADALQSSTRAAVDATIKAAESQVELIARIFAEGGFKRMMRGVYRLLKRHQQEKRIVRLRGSFTPIDPTTWDADLDVVVNVGLGSGSVQERMAILAQLITKQEEWIKALGPQNPLAGLAELRNSVAAFLELAGRRDITRFVKPIDPNAPPPQSPQQQSDPAQLLAQIETQKMQLDAQMRAEELKLKQWEAKQRDDRERDKLEADVMLRSRELEMKYQMDVNEAEIKAMLDRERIEMQREAQQQRLQAGAQQQAAQ